MNKFYFTKLVNAINHKRLDAMLIVPSDELKFIIGESPYLCERFQGLFVKKDGSYFYVCNLLTSEEIQKVLGANVKVYDWFDGDNYIDTVKKAFVENDLIGKTIGVDSTTRAFEVLDIMNNLDVKFIDAKNMLEEIRIHKTSEELENLRIASKIADEAFAEVILHIKPKMTEKDVKEKLCNIMLEKGGESPGALVAAGANSSYPHYIKNTGVIKEKDIVLLDYGCVYKGMKSDISRTVFVGDITKEQKKVYDIVKNAIEAAEKVVAVDAFIPDIDKAARGLIEKEGYGKYFTTRLGHGIGYMGHEAPDIKASNPRYLEKNMAFSIEPGIYIGGNFGVRIEDIVITTENGTEIINKASKDMIIIK